MTHYYLALALLLPPALLATAVSGALVGGAEPHFTLGLATAILCVACNTLVILFMLVTGRVLRQATQTRRLSSGFLVELNRFFAERRGYPIALVGAVLAVATAVLGMGSHIGIPKPVHMTFGLVTVVFELFAAREGWRVLRRNQLLLDAAASELDRLDAAGEPVDTSATEPEWRLGARGRWLVFAASAWGPYLYWGGLVWRGRFGQVPRWFLTLTVLASAYGAVRALLARREADGRTGGAD